MPNHQQQPQEQPQNQRAAADTKFADKAQQAAEQVKKPALERVQQARGAAESGLEERRQEAAERIRRLSNTLRSTRDLQPEDELMGRALDGAAERLDRVAGYVADADFRQMTRDIEGLARNKPAWFFGSSFLVGLALGRLAKGAIGATGSMAAPRGTFGGEEDESYELSSDELGSEYGQSTRSAQPSGTQASGSYGQGASTQGSQGYGQSSSAQTPSVRPGTGTQGTQSPATPGSSTSGVSTQGTQGTGTQRFGTASTPPASPTPSSSTPSSTPQTSGQGPGTRGGSGAP